MIADALFHLATIIALCIVVYLGYSILTASESMSRTMYAYKLALLINATAEGLSTGDTAMIYSPLPISIEDGRVGNWNTSVKGSSSRIVIRLVNRDGSVEVEP